MSGLVPSDGARTTTLLLRSVLEEPALVGLVQELDPRVLGKLIRRVGLEDSGEIVAMASAEQLEQVFDEDLWASDQPGQNESFDAERFALWLEVMLEAGDDWAANRLTEMSEDLVTLGLLRHALVINIDELALQVSQWPHADDQLEKALESCPGEEFGEYRVIARRQDGWDAVVAVLVALDQNHHAFLERLLERCCAVSADTIEEYGGLYDVLTAEAMLEGDAAAEREDRRAQQGYMAPAAAVSFLRLAEQTPLGEIVAATEQDPVTRAYWRELGQERRARPTADRAGPGAGQASAQPSPAAVVGVSADDAAAPTTAAAQRFRELLQQAGVLEDVEQGPALLEGGLQAQGAAPLPLFQRAMVTLRHRDPGRYARRLEEFAYLTNVLMAGHQIDERRLRSVEAAQLTINVCSAGLAHLAERGGYLEDASVAQTRAAMGARKSVDACALLTQEPADKLFRIGWRLAHGSAKRR